MSKLFRFEYRVSILYLVLGVLWIALSDQLLDLLFDTTDQATHLQTLKGIFFILLTATLLFFFIRSHLKRLKKAEDEIQRERDQYEQLNLDYQKQNQELVIAKEKAEENSRMKSNFLQNISHEIRTPMNAIMGFSGMISEPGLTHEKRMQYASIIEGSCNQLLTIVNDVLTMSSIATNQEKEIRSVFNLNQLMTELSDGIRSSLSAETRIKLSLGMEDEHSTVCMDKSKLSMMLENLLNNAAKFTRKGTIELGYRQDSNDLHFFVKDTGIGIPEEKLELIFEQFSKAQDKTEKEYFGTGLGLAICRSFATLLNGNISVESELNKGSTFTIRLPFIPALDENLKIYQLEGERTFTILVAEDELWNYQYLETILKKTEIKLYWAKNGLEAVDMMVKQDDIDLILMDIKMPVLDGFHAAQQIRNIRPEVPIIAQTAYAMDEERARFGSVFDAYITKPISVKTLRQAIVQFQHGRYFH